MAPRPDTTRAHVECVPDAHTALLRGDGLAVEARYILPLGLDTSMVLATLTVRAVFGEFGLAEVTMGKYPITAAQLSGAWVVREHD